MVETAVAGVEACWLDDAGKAAIRNRITTAAAIGPTSGEPR